MLAQDPGGTNGEEEDGEEEGKDDLEEASRCRKWWKMGEGGAPTHRMFNMFNARSLEATPSSLGPALHPDGVS